MHLKSLDSLQKFSAWVKVPSAELLYLREVGDRAYRTYTLPGSNRSIEAPMPRLKKVQRSILRHCAPLAKPHRTAHGSAPTRSSYTNAQKHAEALYLAKLDISKFFPNVRSRMVVHAPREVGFDGEVLSLLAAILTFRRHLPTGAPTSPWLGNLVLAPLDRHMSRFCARRNLIYTRYLDDIVVSGKRCEEGFVEAVRVIRSLGFSCADHKCVPFSQGDSLPIITGYCVGDGKVIPHTDYLDSVEVIVKSVEIQITQMKPVSMKDWKALQGHLAYIDISSPELVAEYLFRLQVSEQRLWEMA